MANQKKLCGLCGQALSIYTTDHKNTPFIDNKKYNMLCFSCCCVPSTMKQTYHSDGTINTIEILDYSYKNLKTPQELFFDGSADSLKEAKICCKAVSESCAGAKHKILAAPKYYWTLC